MHELLDSLSSDNLVVLCFVMGVIALLLAIAISIELFNSNKKYKKMAQDDEKKELDSINDVKINIKESPDIKYVDENDSELEKTKAKIELAELREKLKKEEEEKQRLLEMNLKLSAKNKQEEKVEDEKTLEIKENVKEDTKETLILEEDKDQKDLKNKKVDLDEALKKIRVVDENKESINELEKTKEIILPDVETLDDYAQDENDAIISYEELKNSQTFGYTDEEMDKYVDEKDAIISIEELEKLYLESQKIEVQVEKTPKIEFEMKKVEDLPEISDSNNFQTSPMISPVYGMSKTDQELVLEQTANLEKLNEEIKKTNEFLKTLKDLKKNLE